ncbi:MAG: hypothetical protein H7247_05715 [Polaromonas sp.]|nr:hypothetical protein [Gemmatimonadaceae bacterium]
MDTTPEDFRILPIKRDAASLLLIGLAVVIALLMLVSLAFLPEAAWDRLQERSRLLWGAALAAAPILLVAWQRFSLRKAAVTALGRAAAGAPLTVHETSPLEPIYGVMSHTEAHDTTQQD